jgi:hypothetical protein
VAALTTIFTWTRGDLNVAALVGAAAIVVAGVFRMQARISEPTKTWYQGRAAAESAKTLAWRYAVGGEPFAVWLDEAEADQLFVTRLNDVLLDLDGLVLETADEGDEITDWMRETRTFALEERRSLYAEARIAEQRSWYSDKAAVNSRRSNLLGLTTLLFEAAAVIQALLTATGLVDLELLAFMATVIAGIVAWMQTKDYQNLANAYTVASRELAAIGSLLRHQQTEEDWPSFVANAEESISREHTLWRASRI